MNEIPEFWRPEIWHPMTVHAPLAFLIFASLLKMIAFLKEKLFAFDRLGSLLLIIGVAGAWLAIYTGNIADGIVSRQICDPTVLKEHQNMAFLSALLFSLALLLDLIPFIQFFSRFKKHIQFLSVLIMLGGSGFLIYAGHLGATLVYQQAAGVYTPTEDCKEFE